MSEDEGLFSLLACGLWPQIRALLEQRPQIFQSRGDVEDSLGLWVLSQSGWDARWAETIRLVVDRTAKILGGSASVEVKTLAVASMCLFLQLDAKQTKSMLASVWKQPWFLVRSDWRNTVGRLLEDKGEDTVEVASHVESLSVAIVHGVQVIKGSRDSSIDSGSHPISAKQNLRNLAEVMTISANHVPVLVRGEAGSGKTWSIRTLAKMCGQELIELQLDDQIDSKTLLGSMASVRGSFAWVPGALTQAIHAGRWVLVEDIDSCPLEVLYALKPLFETGKISLPNRSTAYDLIAHSGFRLFATSANDTFNLPAHSEVVFIQALSSEELNVVCTKKYAKTLQENVVSAVITTVLEVVQEHPDVSSSSQPVRDLMKWLDREGQTRYCT
jgi:AAA domain (dynein-related subfamily)